MHDMCESIRVHAELHIMPYYDVYRAVTFSREVDFRPGGTYIICMHTIVAVYSVYDALCDTTPPLAW